METEGFSGKQAIIFLHKSFSIQSTSYHNLGRLNHILRLYSYSPRDKLWKWASISTGTPLGDHGGVLLCQGLRDKGEFLFYQETLFIGDCERYLTEDSLNRDPLEESGGGLVLQGTRALETECLSLSLSVCLGNLQGVLGGRAPLL
jgi:hypothetical protein